MKNILFPTGLLILLLVACNKNNSSGIEASNHEVHATTVALNSGQKWNANPETTEGIAVMLSLFKTLPEKPTVEDYKNLKTELDKEFDMILQKCTMTGEANNQLHNYLLPLKERMEKLASNTIDEAKVASNDIQKYLGEYYSYFQ